MAEAEFFDRMEAFLFGPAQEGPPRFVLSEVAGLYVLPRSYPYSKQCVSLQKSASALMRLYSIAVAHHDWAAYRHEDEEDSRVFRSSAFAAGLGASDWAELSPSVKESLLSLGVHSLLPLTLQRFGFSCMDRHHPVHLRLVFNYEREWAWALCSAYMTEVCVNSRVFIQPTQTTAVLERVTSGLPNASIYPSERASTHGLWTFGAVVGFMLRASVISEQHLHPWVDFTTSSEAFFLEYDTAKDVFLSRTSSRSAVRGGKGRRASVGSESRRGWRKRDSDLDGVTAGPLALVADDPTRDVGPSASTSPTTIPPLDTIESDPVSGNAVCALALTADDIASIPNLSRAFGAARCRVWTVGSLLGTLGDWFLTRSNAARDLRAALDPRTVEKRELQREVASMPTASQRQTRAYERALHDCRRYRQERDRLQSAGQRRCPTVVLPRSLCPSRETRSVCPVWVRSHGALRLRCLRRCVARWWPRALRRDAQPLGVVYGDSSS